MSTCCNIETVIRGAVDTILKIIPLDKRRISQCLICIVIRDKKHGTKRPDIYKSSTITEI